MPRIACFVMETPTHFGNAMLIVAELVRAGATVRVWTASAYRAQIEAAGAEFADLFDPVSLAAVGDTSRHQGVTFVSFAAARGEAFATAARNWGATLVLYDSFALIGRAVAARLDVPYVPLFSGHALDGRALRTGLLSDPRVRLEPQALQAVERLRDEFGIADASPFSYAGDPSPHLNVHFEPAEWMSADEHGRLGPLVCFGSLPADALDQPPPPRGDGEVFHVYAALGTVVWRYWTADAAAALQVIAAAVAGMPGGRLTVGLGRARLPDAARAALEQSGAHLLDFADQWQELRTADAFITHHGLASTHEAVAFGAPMLSVPFFWDQPALARRSAELGIALPLLSGVLPTEPLQPATVGAALQRVADGRTLMQERLAEAREWERRTVAARPETSRQIMALA